MEYAGNDKNMNEILTVISHSVGNKVHTFCLLCKGSKASLKGFFLGVTKLLKML